MQRRPRGSGDAVAPISVKRRSAPLPSATGGTSILTGTGRRSAFPGRPWGSSSSTSSSRRAAGALPPRRGLRAAPRRCPLHGVSRARPLLRRREARRPARGGQGRRDGAQRSRCQGPTLVVMEDFDFGRLGRLRLRDRPVRLPHLRSTTSSGASYGWTRCWPGREVLCEHLGERAGKAQPRADRATPGIVTYFDRNPSTTTTRRSSGCARARTSPEYVGEWNNPRNQKMLVFTKTDAWAPEAQARTRMASRSVRVEGSRRARGGRAGRRA